MRLISEMIKNVANDIGPIICIFSLLIYKWHLDLTSSGKLLIHFPSTYTGQGMSYLTGDNLKAAGPYFQHQHGAKTFSITPLSLAAFSIMTISITSKKSQLSSIITLDTECCYAECSLCWVSPVSPFCWVSLCWMSSCWVSLCWMS